MNNQFKKVLDTQEEDLQELEELEIPKEPLKEGSKTAFFRKLFVEGVVTKESATGMFPFIVFLCFLVMIYIANSHYTIKNIRSIDKLSKEIKELSSEYKTLKADLMFKSKMTEGAKKVDTLGLKELIEPPKKIVISDEY
jgi:cell shape-determining protein MreC